MSDASTKQPGVAARIQAFYRERPEEELTFADLTAKFGCSPETVRKAVYDLIDSGELESVRVVRRRERGIAQEEERHL